LEKISEKNHFLRILEGPCGNRFDSPRKYLRLISTSENGNYPENTPTPKEDSKTTNTSE